MLGLMTGDPLKKFIDNAVRGLPLPLATGGLEMAVLVMSSYLFVLNEILSKDTLLWKLQLLEFASSYVNARLQAVKAQVLILSSGKDQLFPSNEESQRLRSALPKSDTRAFDDNGHFLFLEDGPDLVTIIKGSTLYRRGRCRDYVADYIPPTPLEFKKLVDKYSSRKIVVATNPVMFSTMNDGKIIKGLDGIPSEGPVLIVGYHMLMGVDSSPLVTQIMLERNLLVRGIAHPMVFSRLKDGFMPPLSHFDDFRVMGAAPVSGTALFKLLSSKAHVLLYPGGLREAFHRKGEQYQLFWPERSEFVRMAARFGAKIVPFGVVGEDDYGEVCFDYNDQMKIPFLRDILQSITEETPQLRTEADGGLGGQGLHFPVCRPKLPGRFYFLFGKPIETQGRKEELSRDREKAHELYLEVKQEVYNSIDYLKKKRESDPYRNVLARIAYQTIHGFDSPVPTFEI
ncbi:Phytyl ester synthase 2, chloroplastic [Linum perenne]